MLWPISRPVRTTRLLVLLVLRQPVEHASGDEEDRIIATETIVDDEEIARHAKSEATLGRGPDASRCAEVRLGVARDDAELTESGEVKEYELNPKDCGFELCQAEDLKGSDAPANATLIEKILDGEGGPKRDIVVLNAGAALLMAGEATDLKSACEKSAKAIDSGKAKALLEKVRQFTNA